MAIDDRFVFSQNDSRWADLPIYNDSKTYADEGCFVTCLAMIESTLARKEIYPPEFAKRFLAINSWRVSLQQVKSKRFNVKFILDNIELLCTREKRMIFYALSSLSQRGRGFLILGTSRQHYSVYDDGKIIDPRDKKRKMIDLNLITSIIFLSIKPKIGVKLNYKFPIKG